MQQSIVDFSFLYEISDNDPGYIQDVLEIFMSTMPEGVETLAKLAATDDWDAIHKQAHFLKSSAGIVRIHNIFEELNTVEMLAKEKKDKEAVVKLVGNIVSSFAQAVPVIQAEQEKGK